MEQNSAISSAVPGSWPLNWLDGTPMTVNPAVGVALLEAFQGGVLRGEPQREATLTSSTALPRYWTRSAGFASRGRRSGCQRWSWVLLMQGWKWGAEWLLIAASQPASYRAPWRLLCSPSPPPGFAS
jgi:hypothetical protein